jgi:hypothetical protein
MLKVQGTINDREILYIDIKDSITEFEQMDLNSWVCYVIADDISHPFLNLFAECSISKNLLYMAATGKACSEVDDLFDMEIVNRKIEGLKMPDWYQCEDDVLLTTWNQSLSEGFWFLTTTARYDDHPIKTVLVANFTEVDFFEEIQFLTNNIRAGWIPSE